MNPSIEKTIKLENGCRARLKCTLARVPGSKEFKYLIDCSIAQPRKKTFVKLLSPYRKSESEDIRIKYNNKVLLDTVGLGECVNIARELWASLNPEILEIRGR